MSKLFGPVLVRWEGPGGDVRTREFVHHSLSPGWIVGYDKNENPVKKIPRNRVYEVEVLGR
ncbi:hypothetical protein HUG10_21140 (plasmid) [Halorarum halophilum]|uniref:Uncharacterized protein n=1 Tax=Halorarum halophilum TaxID=2743090 RepID=A0A7D5KAR7_9EURY|nr:hypothetical protein [Halobaculum halophilum]QLG30094.1 hypothetical protein HUG10_21140 [Halobaculum halophilum]